ncbi:hypothetical protein NDU88_005994 [Pleurodeles waltl]|uniref:Peptidase A2 domain-containing protein n=1 Tax=Pleurodeles waltl TaxID=8319 RepID=A0AAV7TWD5_PLEWA|nr:hypothetical protein NDU88_005994 [Pleurodeles waltl]
MPARERVASGYHANAFFTLHVQRATEQVFCKSAEKKMVKVNETEYDCKDEDEEKSFVLQVVNDVNCVTNVRCEYPVDIVEVDGVKVSMMMDSGAKLTLISESDYLKYFVNTVSLLLPDDTPFSYGGKPIELKGYLEAKIAFKGNMIEGKVYIPVVGDTILGWPHQKMLNIVLNPVAVPQVQVQKVCGWGEELLNEFPEVFSN